MNIKDKTLSTPDIIVVWLGLLIIICGFIFSYFNTKDYNVELQAVKTEEVNLNEDREVIGYCRRGKVYNKSAILVSYVSTYEYIYNGEIFEFTLRQVTEGEDSIRIYVDEYNPSNFCLAEDKVSLKELAKIKCR